MGGAGCLAVCLGGVLGCFPSCFAAGWDVGVEALVALSVWGEQ